MRESSSSPNYARWAVTGVIIPVLVILILRFAIAPFVWSSDVTARLGSALGGIFVLWLLLLAVAATLWKLRHESKGDEKDEREGS
jgi:succinate dehydrogenase hydrophobic anchor subunit